MQSYFEQMGGTYRQDGDYLAPDLALPDVGTGHIGRYGRLRRRYLEEHRPAIYTAMLMNGELFAHLAEIDRVCGERMERMCAAMA